MRRADRRFVLAVVAGPFRGQTPPFFISPLPSFGLSVPHQHPSATFVVKQLPKPIEARTFFGPTYPLPVSFTPGGWETRSREPLSTIRSGELCQICDKSSPQTPRIPPDSHRSQPRKNAHKSLPLLDLRAKTSDDPIPSNVTRGEKTGAGMIALTTADLPCAGCVPRFYDRWLGQYAYFLTAAHENFTTRDRWSRHPMTAGWRCEQANPAIGSSLRQRSYRPSTQRMRGDPILESNSGSLPHCLLQRDRAVPLRNQIPLGPEKTDPVVEDNLNSFQINGSQRVVMGQYVARVL